MNRDSGALELCVLVLYRTELYNKLIYALNDAGIRGATTVSSSGMMSALADSEDSHIIAAFRAFMASEKRTSSSECGKWSARRWATFPRLTRGYCLRFPSLLRTDSARTRARKEEKRKKR